MFYKNSDIDFLDLVRKKSLVTPVVVYDDDQLNFTIKKIEKIFSKYDFLMLSYAVKASYSSFFLKKFSSAGMGCDVASRFEYEQIKNNPFRFVTTTAPYYSVEDMKYFTQESILIDLNSLDQIKQFKTLGISDEIGLRVRINFPEWGNQNLGTYGKESRFGVELTQKLLDYISNNKLKVKRLHTHTGQMTPSLLVYKVKYLLEICKHLTDVEIINLGGGLFHLLKDEEQIAEALSKVESIISEFYKDTNRKISIILEPGGAVTVPFGYLLTKVISKQLVDKSEIVTVDSSAWNFLPWNVYHIENLSSKHSSKNELVKVAGCTLFEGDYFGVFDNSIKKHKLSEVKVGDLLVVHASGGYSYTNSRTFNGIGLPGEYVYYNDERR